MPIPELRFTEAEREPRRVDTRPGSRSAPGGSGASFGRALSSTQAVLMAQVFKRIGKFIIKGCSTKTLTSSAMTKQISLAQADRSVS